MITADLTGNIGDHLKIYALTRTIAEKNGYQWGFNPVPSHDYYDGSEQMYFLNIDYGIKHSSPWGITPEGIEHIVSEPIIPIRVNGQTANYHPFTPELFNIKDNTKLIVNCAQNFKYYDGKKEDIRKWFEIKPKYSESYEQEVKNFGITFDDNLCILNARGGEYLGVREFSLTYSYWENAMNLMLKRNPNMKFMCITDDPNYYKKMFCFSVDHFSIGIDYYIINHAKNLIISNSAFAMFPAWLNDDAYVIAPLYWARHNTSDGQWIYSEINIPEWHWMDRYGKFHNI